MNPQSTCSSHCIANVTKSVTPPLTDMWEKHSTFSALMIVTQNILEETYPAVHHRMFSSIGVSCIIHSHLLAVWPPAPFCLADNEHVLLLPCTKGGEGLAKFALDHVSLECKLHVPACWWCASEGLRMCYVLWEASRRSSLA